MTTHKVVTITRVIKIKVAMVAKAMAKGSATTPTVMPAPKSFKKRWELYPCKLSTMRGLKGLSVLRNPGVAIFSF